ncbi:uncharacterized protein isoform X2 [Leptinotarsa decemlineata]|uniref:uncharacterized protein isoform X2 n=1 Tax=Leptinotarsa decemlineata TaxID=7539 RepID=UPI003D307CE3
MIDPDFYPLMADNYKQIEDIIDSRKSLGQYNVNKQNNGINYRYAYSNSSSTSDSNRYIRFEENVVLNEGDSLNNSNIKQTDSEITVMRVKCNDSSFKRRKSKWDMHDIAIPGDGSHLGESPSLVNLVTLVGDSIPFEGEEYLVPLSSWDPYVKSEDFSTDVKYCSDSKLNEAEFSSKKINSRSEQCQLKGNESDLIQRRGSWAGRISKFIRKHCTKTRTLPDGAVGFVLENKN